MADHPEPVRSWIKFLMPSRSVRVLQANLTRAEPGILASYALTGAVIAFGGLGYLLDRSFDTAPWWLLVGLLNGTCLGFYNLVKIAWRR